MTKQLITLIGALISAAVIVAAVLVGVVPLIGGVVSADSQREQVAATNAGFEKQIASLTTQKAHLTDIQGAVTQLRGQIPEQQLLNQVFERISRAATDAGVTVTDASRGDLETFAARTGAKDAAAATAAPAPAPTPTPTPTTGTPIDAAKDTAGQANANAAATDAASGATPATGTPAPAASTRQQVQLSVRISAPDIASTFAFLDGLRAGPRAIAIDTATTTESGGAFEMQITAIAFLQSTGGE
jgi:TolA-binding protein